MQKSHKTYFHSDPSIRQTGRRRGMYATPPMDTGGLQAALTVGELWAQAEQTLAHTQTNALQGSRRRPSFAF